MSAIAGLLVKLAADTAEFQESMTEAAEVVTETAESIQESLSTMQEGFEALMAFTAFEQLSEASAQASEAMAQLEAAVRATGATTGVTSDQVNELVENLSHMSGQSEASVTKMEATLTGFNRISSSVLPQASKAVMDLSAATGKDLTSSAMLLGRALQDPIKGTTMLTRAGVTLTAAQKEQIKGFLAVNDAADAQRAIIDAVEAKCNGFAASLRDNLGGAFKALGSDTEKVAEQLLGGDNGGIRFALEILDDLMQKVAKQGPVLAAAFNGVAAAGATLLIFNTAEAATAACAAAMEALATGGLTLLVPALAAIVGGLVAVASTNTQAGEAVREFAATAYSGFKQVINGAMQLGSVFIDVVSAAVMGTIHAFEDWYEEASQVVQWIVANVPFVGTALKGIVWVVQEVTGIIAGEFTETFNAIIRGAQIAGKAIGDLISYAVKTIPGLSAVAQKVSGDMHTDFVSGFFNPIEGEFKQVGDQIKEWDAQLASMKNKAMNVEGSDLLSGGKGKGGGSQQALQSAQDLEKLQSKIADDIQRQAQRGQDVLQNMQNQLDTEKAKVAGEESSVALNQKIEEITKSAASATQAIEKATAEAAKQQERLASASKATAATKEQAQRAIVEGTREEQKAITQINQARDQQIAKAKVLFAQTEAEKATEQQHKAVIDQIVKSTETLEQKQIELKTALAEQLISIKEYSAETKKLAEEQAKQQAQELKAGEKISETFKTQIEQIQDKIKGEGNMLPLLNAQRQLAQQTKDLSQQEQQQLQANLIKDWNELQKQTTIYNKQEAIINRILQKKESQLKKEKELVAEYQSGNITLGECDDAVQQTINDQDTLNSKTEQWGGLINQAFNLMTAGVKNFTKQLESLVEKFVELIAKALILATLTAVFDPAAIAQANGFMAFMGKTFGKGIGIPGFADGGEPPVGMPSLVGENGPELFIPHTSGTIISNSALSSGSAGGGAGQQPQQINVHVVQKIPANISASMQLGPDGQQQLMIMVDQAIEQATRSGGALYQLLTQNGLQLSTVQR